MNYNPEDVMSEILTGIGRRDRRAFILTECWNGIDPRTGEFRFKPVRSFAAYKGKFFEPLASQRPRHQRRRTKTRTP